MSLQAYILAGGKSSRMGEEKGMILLKGKPMIAHVIDAAKQVVDHVTIVSSNHVYQSFDLPLLADEIQHIGPAGAIDSILTHSNTTHNLILACDMPFVDAISLQFLIHESNNSDITVPMYNQFPEALLGIYASSCREKWHDAVMKGTLKLSELLSLFTTKFVDGNDLCRQNPFLFHNINSKEDVSKANSL